MNLVSEKKESYDVRTPMRPVDLQTEERFRFLSQCESQEQEQASLRKKVLCRRKIAFFGVACVGVLNAVYLNFLDKIISPSSSDVKNDNHIVLQEHEYVLSVLLLIFIPAVQTVALGFFLYCLTK